MTVQHRVVVYHRKVPRMTHDARSDVLNHHPHANFLKRITFNFSRETYSIPEKLVKFFNVTKTTDNTMNFLKNVDGLYDFYTESDKNVDGSIKALKNVTGIGKNSKVFSIFDKYGTKTVKTIEDVVGLIGG